jgi:hypothetical protein
MDCEPMRPEPLSPEPPPPATIAGLLAALEALSRSRPDRVLRLSGSLPAAALENGWAAATDPLPADWEPFELLIFRGFSSLTTHPTAFDPDRAALPEAARISGAELLAAPLNPSGGVRLRGPLPVAAFLELASWA